MDTQSRVDTQPTENKAILLVWAISCHVVQDIKLCPFLSRLYRLVAITVDLQKLRYAIFTRESSYCFQRVLAIAIMSVRPSATRVNQSKMVQARITKSSPSGARKTLVSETVKLFYKFEGGHPERGRVLWNSGLRLKTQGLKTAAVDFV